MSNTVTQEQVNSILNNSTIEYQKFGNKTLVGVCTLPNGFILVEDASCVDPVNFCENIGRDIIFERFTNKIWELEGYKLQAKVYSKTSDIARLCHEVNKAYCQSIGDNSQPSWDNAPQWQKDSAINGVEFHLNNKTTPEQSHENWMKDKVADGWVYGEVKCPDKKTHPCMVPYNQLPLEQRTKDYLFKAIVDSY